MPQRKVLMLASTAKQGPWVPLSEEFEIESEGVGPEDEFCVSRGKETGGEWTDLWCVIRTAGTNPISVYANCDD